MYIFGAPIWHIYPVRQLCIFTDYNVRDVKLRNFNHRNEFLDQVLPEDIALGTDRARTKMKNSQERMPDAHG